MNVFVAPPPPNKQVCVFFQKIGACRHGVNCCRAHDVPTTSRTVLLENMCSDKLFGRKLFDFKTTTEEQQYFDELFDILFQELEDEYGSIDELHVCGNMGDHLDGNVYVKFMSTSSAFRALSGLNSRWFASQPIYASLSPVNDFREACCRQFEVSECARGDYCNFMHVRPISRHVMRRLYKRKRAPRLSSPPRSPHNKGQRSPFLKEKSSPFLKEKSSPFLKEKSSPFLTPPSIVDEFSHLPATYRISAALNKASEAMHDKQSSHASSSSCNGDDGEDGAKLPMAFRMHNNVRGKRKMTSTD